jgi:hypothetical protein
VFLVKEREMSKAHHRVALIAGAALATAAVAAIPALASQVVKIDSKVTISHRAPAFHGHVKSDNSGCESFRKVKLFRQRHGPDRLLGHDRTSNRGRWEVDVDPLSSGAYYAKVTRRAEGAAGTIFVCRRDRSKTVVVD